MRRILHSVVEIGTIVHFMVQLETVIVLSLDLDLARFHVTT